MIRGLVEADVLVGCDGIHSVVRQAVFTPSGTWSLGGSPYAEMRDTIPDLVREVHDSAQRSDRIIEDLKDFARPCAQEAPTALQVNDAVQRTLRLLAHLIKKHMDHLHVDLASGLPSV